MRRLILSVLLFGSLFPFALLSEQVLPDDIHAMPVLIEIPLADGINSSFGTGIYLHESNRVFLVTAAHCLFNPFSTDTSALINSNATISSLIGQKDAVLKDVLSFDLKRLQDGGRIKRHPTHDVAVIQFANSRKSDTNDVTTDKLLPGVRVLVKSGNLTTWDTADCMVFTNIPDGNETCILGYPVELLNTGIHSQVDFGYPLIRKGVISQKNQQLRKLIIDSGVYGGNSGGTVLVVQHEGNVINFRVAGIITEFVPVATKVFPQVGVTNSVWVNSGYGVAEPIDYALELMRQF
jgi:hypothetical protein